LLRQEEEEEDEELLLQEEEEQSVFNIALLYTVSTKKKLNQLVILAYSNHREML